MKSTEEKLEEALALIQDIYAVCYDLDVRDTIEDYCIRIKEEGYG